MTNAQRFKTAEERARAYQKFCSATGMGCNKCPLRKVSSVRCPFEWLNLEYREEPKPCPFCGSESVEIFRNDNLDGWRVSCNDCGITTKEETNKEMAIAAWNRRKV